MSRLLDDPSNIADNLHTYLRGFSRGAADVLPKFDLPMQVDRLARADLLYLVVSKFCEIDLHPDPRPLAEIDAEITLSPAWSASPVAGPAHAAR
jgi:type I restriction enzyme M protein